MAYYGILPFDCEQIYHLYRLGETSFGDCPYKWQTSKWQRHLLYAGTAAYSGTDNALLKGYIDNSRNLWEGSEEMSFEELMDWYTGALLGTIPCMRMSNVAGRWALIDHQQLKGVVYNTVKFCDFYGFDYAVLKEQTDVPILKIESDHMPQPSGQLTIRLEALSESLGLQACQEGKDMEKSAARAAGLYAGIDSGSTTTNMVVINEKKSFWHPLLSAPGPRPRMGPKQLWKKSAAS